MFNVGKIFEILAAGTFGQQEARTAVFWGIAPPPPSLLTGQTRHRLGCVSKIAQMHRHLRPMMAAGSCLESAVRRKRKKNLWRFIADSRVRFCAPSDF